MNDPLYSAVQANTEVPPIGSSAVLELYNDAAGKSFKSWAVLAQGLDGADASTWFSLEIDAQNGSFSAPAVPTDAMGASACSVCHTGEPQYMMPVAF